MTFFSHLLQPYKLSRPARAPATELGRGGSIRTTDPLSSSLAPVRCSWQGISGISKGSQNILIYNISITTFDCQGRSISAKAFALACPGVASPLTQKLQFRQNNTE